MPNLRDFPEHIPESAMVHLTRLQASVVFMFREERLTQAQIARELVPPRSQPAVSKILKRALDKINGGSGQGYARSLGAGDVDRAVAIA